MSGTAEGRRIVLAEWMNEQAVRYRNGCCIHCGEPVIDCWCGEYDDEPRSGGASDDEQAPA